VPSAVIVDEARFDTDPALSRLLGGATPHLLLGAGSIVASVEEKRRLREQTGAAAVDQESGTVGQVASAHGIPFAVLRSICDPADRALPPAALAALGWRGEIEVWRVLISIVAHPGQLPALFELAAAAAAARRSLVERVRQIAGAAMQSGLPG
jgi:adenosylhomocysteine nucleosidase